jgi:molecular chaperone GrpE
LNNEDQRREHEPREEKQGDTEPVEEAQGSPGDPAAADEDVEVVEEPPVEEPEISEVDIAALSEELEATRRERDDYLDALRRIKAEFENSRKRAERERERILRTASEGLITELLPVLDNLDRALEHEGDIHDGVRATRDQFADVLGRQGLLPVASDGQSFDPNVHEAVMSQPSEDHEEGTIIQTFERGYVLNGKPIRPAKVVVATQG